MQQNGGPGLLTPTAATVTSFDARARGRGVELRWRTASEAGVAGFDVFRVHVRRTTRVNARLIEATGSAGGGRYRLVDRTARRGATYKYRLQLVRLDGSRGVVRSIRVRAR